jgi:hypothetical protein
MVRIDIGEKIKITQNDIKKLSNGIFFKKKAHKPATIFRRRAIFSQSRICDLFVLSQFHFLWICLNK